MIASVCGRKARFCNSGCAESFREDRKHDLIYGAIHTPDGVYTPERWSLVAGTCCYCGSQVTMQPHFGKLGPNWGPEHSKHPEVVHG